MATKTDKANSRKVKLTREKIYDSYMDYVLLNGRQPSSIYAFCKDLKASEADFYNHFNSFGSIEKSIWQDLLKSTLENLYNDEDFQVYSVREKLLAFYFAFFETLKSSRSFILSTFNNFSEKDTNPEVLRWLKEEFNEFANELITQGVETGEIIMRPYISERYKDGFWLQFLLLIRFWIKDDSIGFENTDAAIEKSVNLGFDFIGKGPIDSLIDFAKFLYQNK